MSMVLGSVRRTARDLSTRCTKRSSPLQTQCRRALTNSTPCSAEPLSQDSTQSTSLQQANVQELAQTDPTYADSDISSLAHAELERHREQRRILRTAAWEMPLLNHLAKPYEKPDKKKLPLRWRYTTYMGELHPASRKVVVEFMVGDIEDLTDAQRQTLRKVVGPRYNPQTDTVKMSCESFETQAQNRRYLSDKIKDVIAYTKDPKADTFADVPLDTRHVKSKAHKLQFPVEWRLTAERKQQLDAAREKSLLEESRRLASGQVIDGHELVKQALATQYEPVPVLAEADKRRSTRK